jgi:predicted N-acetyltransferase YhbS
MNAAISLNPDNGQYDGEVEALYARAFGPGRLAKAATRLREGHVCRRDLSFIARKDDMIVGACRMWPIVDNDGVRALFLGPIAVDKAAQSAGLGKQLVTACLAAAEVDQARVIILVGDMSFFGPLGFDIIPPGRVTMPGPVDPNRLLWRLQRETVQNLPTGQLSDPRATNQRG